LKLLIIDEEFPYPLNSGKRIRSFNLARELAGLNEITYLAYGEVESPAARQLRDNDIKTEAVSPRDRKQSGPKFYTRLAANLYSDLPYIVTSHYTPRYAEKLATLMVQEKYDLVICEWTPYAVFVRDLPGIKKVIVAHNIESSIWQRYLATEKNPLKRFYISLQAKKVARFEQNCYRWVDGATAVSDAEARQITRFGGNYPVEVIANGVAVDYFAPREVSPDPDKLVFTGSMDWRPNQDAALFFVHEILPRIKEKRPEISVLFVGRKPPKKIKKLESVPGVTITGTVPDVRPFIADGSVYIVPLRIGGGSRLKILEAMAMRRPVVSTTVGAEGLEVTPDENILLADNPEGFAAAVLRCLNDHKLSRKLSDEGYRLVHRTYRWPELAKKFHNYLQGIVGR